ncbi:piggyBac transposable element-derived protein 4-like isoform X2 [Leptidea sinapis]|uniref:piggyBac transposable element-derived protein 4-like isoform X2 n=1 Tax=Leptidea sinapis TaxID=189913 RepID=UPI0021268791|nr:piggyBac transposable element-derived protein 4-like isoform X2 [Leptidea sinapis]
MSESQKYKHGGQSTSGEASQFQPDYKEERPIGAFPADSRQEIMDRKRKAQLERMLLPDAPPRKRRSKKASPDRDPCLMIDVCPREPQPSTSGVTRSSDLHSAEPEPPTSSVTSPVGTNDYNFDPEVEECLRLSNFSDENDDLSSDCLLQDPTFMTNGRNALTEPGCVSDLSAFQAEVLRTEDEASDRALRDIVPEDCYSFNWNKDRNSFKGQREVFTETHGPTFQITNQTRPIDIFYKMFDDDFLDLLCIETNRYAVQKIAMLQEQNKLSSFSRLQRWTPTNRDEMIIFLAIIILQGLYPLPEEEAFFKFNGFGTMPFFGKIMSFNRYFLLKSMLHFVDNQTLQDTTKICKIRPVVDYFNKKFSGLYVPSQEIAIDESLLKWHGRLSFAQKITSKAAKVGIKTYELCESSSGYLWKFFVYTGKEKLTSTTVDKNIQIGQPDEELTIYRSGDYETNDWLDGDTSIVLTDTTDIQPIDRPTNATAKIVYTLIEPLLNRGYTLVMDNFYNSPLLLRFLKKQKTDCYGTLRLNREFVPETIKTLTKTDLRHGEAVASYCSDLSVLVWRDANLVSMISTFHNLQIGTSDKYNRLTYKPSIVLDYNKTMGGIDRKDQFLFAQPIERLRNKIWFKKLFRRLYNSALFNCFVIFSGVHQNISHRKFRTVLAEELLLRHRHIDLTTEYRLFSVRARSAQVTSKVRSNLRHRTQSRPTVDSNHFPIRTGSKYTVCCMCPKKSRTIWKCEECDVNLCIEDCFKLYHKP